MTSIEYILLVVQVALFMRKPGHKPAQGCFRALFIVKECEHPGELHNLKVVFNNQHCELPRKFVKHPINCWGA